MSDGFYARRVSTAVMRRILLVALLFATALPAFGFGVILYPTYIEITPGQSVGITACTIGGFSTMLGRLDLTTDTPDIVSLERAPFNGGCGGYFVTGLRDGTATLVAPGTTAKATVVVVDCQDFPRVGAPTRTIDAVAGQPVVLNPNAEIHAGGVLYEWFAGAVGDRSQPMHQYQASLTFTPPDAKTYRIWIEITDRCATKRVEFLVDATIKRRRAVRR
jgi:hypothetical protein